MSPCNRCLLIPICRHKSYFNLLAQCSSLQTYIYDETIDGKHFKFKLNSLGDLLKPTDWDPVIIYRGSERIGGIASR